MVPLSSCPWLWQRTATNWLQVGMDLGCPVGAAPPLAALLHGGRAVACRVQLPALIPALLCLRVQAVGHDPQSPRWVVAITKGLVGHLDAGELAQCVVAVLRAVAQVVFDFDQPIYCILIICDQRTATLHIAIILQIFSEEPLIYAVFSASLKVLNKTYLEQAALQNTSAPL